MKILIILVFFINVTLINLQSHVKSESKSKRGANFVPDKETASKIAGIILKNIYGEDNINKQLPLQIHLNEKDVWIISGSKPKPSKGKYFIGGVAMIAIQRSDCKILYVTHGM